MHFISRIRTLTLLAASVTAAMATAAPADTPRAMSLLLGYTRATASATVPGMLNTLSPKARAAFEMLETKDVAENELLADFFANATETVIVNGSRALAGWRNPVADVWLLSEWRQGANGWQIVRATLSLTQDLGNAPTPNAALQSALNFKKAAGVADAVAAAHQQAQARFARAAQSIDAIAWGNAAAWTRAREVALLRLDAARISREALAKTTHKAADALIQTALVEETPAVLEVSDVLAKKLAALPTEVRLSLKTLRAYEAPASSGKGRAVYALVASALDTNDLWIVELRGSGDAAQPVRIANVEHVDFSAT